MCQALRKTNTAAYAQVLLKSNAQVTVNSFPYQRRQCHLKDTSQGQIKLFPAHLIKHNLQAFSVKVCAL